jgi:tRNA threonylcarbamoyladenosine biosynthesis protein TsaB
LRGSGRALPLLPDARAFSLLPDGFLDSKLAPIYGRAPDARLPEARG